MNLKSALTALLASPEARQWGRWLFGFGGLTVLGAFGYMDLAPAVGLAALLYWGAT